MHAAETQVAAIVRTGIAVVAVRRRSAGAAGRGSADLSTVAGVTVVTDQGRMHAGTTAIADVVSAQVIVVETRCFNGRKAGIGFIVAEVGAVAAARAGIAAVNRATTARAHIIAGTVKAVVAGLRVVGMHTSEQRITAVVRAFVRVIAVGRGPSQTTAAGVAGLQPVTGVAVIAHDGHVRARTAVVADVLRAGIAVIRTRIARCCEAVL